jgi:hypothetical protein
MRLYDAFGNRGALAAIEMCLGLISNVVSQNGGFVVKTIGDEIMAAFPDPAATWLAALEVQRKIDALPPLRGPQGLISHGLRVGFTYGPAIENNGDFFGATVNVAARMVQLAKRGQIITTGDDETLLPPNLRFQTRGLDRVAVKGKPDGVLVVEVMWQNDSGSRTTVIGAQVGPSPPEMPTELRFSLGGQSWVFGASHDSLSLGREPRHDVVLPGSAASRNHATIERRRDRWVLIDHSSNGTFVETSSGVIHLRREEVILARAGRIGFGQPIEAHPEEAASFDIRSSGE